MTGRDKSPALPFWAPPAGQTPTIDLLMSLISSLNKHIRYESRPEGPARAPIETVELGVGSCRDTARLLLALLRDLGFAARLVSGYLWEPAAKDSTKRRADGFFHAWTEVALPGAGWVGLAAPTVSSATIISSPAPWDSTPRTSRLSPDAISATCP